MQLERPPIDLHVGRLAVESRYRTAVALIFHRHCAADYRRIEQSRIQIRQPNRILLRPASTTCRPAGSRMYPFDPIGHAFPSTIAPPFQAISTSDPASTVVCEPSFTIDFTDAEAAASNGRSGRRMLFSK